MIIKQFLTWIEGARVEQRVDAATALANAYLGAELAFEDRCEAEAALTLLLDDPSPLVRLALSEAFSLSHRAPPQIIAALAADQPQVAAPVLIRSPVLGEEDLIQLIRCGRLHTQEIIAARPYLGWRICAAIAEAASARACRIMLDNEGADIPEASLRLLAERLGGDGSIRFRLLERSDLPPDCRHRLLCRHAEALGGAALLRATVGQPRAQRIAREARMAGSLALIDATAPARQDELAAHMVAAGEVSGAFLVRLVAFGRMDFLAAVLATICGRDRQRVNAILASGRDGAVMALLSSAGIDGALHSVFVRALIAWRAVANGQLIAGPQEVSRLMLSELGEQGDASLAAMLKAIHLETLRENARDHALALAA